MSYRADFWINSTFGVLIELGLAYFVCLAIYAGAPSENPGGFARDAMVFYFVIALLTGRLVRGEEFEGTVSADIYEGGLNRYLLFPVGYFVFKFAQRLGQLTPVAVQVLVFAALVPLILDIPPENAPTVTSSLMFLATLAVGNLLYFLMGFPIQCIAFWADNVWSLEVARRMVAMFLGGGMFPLALFPGWAEGALAYLPFRYFYAVPAEVLMRRMDASEWALALVGALAWCVLFAGISRWIYRRGLLQYSGIGI